MDRYDTNSKGTSPALSALLNKFAEMPRSAFDETRNKDLDCMPYGIIPVECFLMFPNSEGYLRYDVSSLSRNPTIKRMLSSMRIELRTYMCRCSDLWEGWNNFVTKGRSGKLNMSIPYVDFIHNSKHSALPYNPAHYLNIAPAVNFALSQETERNTGIRDVTETDAQSNPLFSTTGLLGSGFSLASSDAYSKGISALPFVMYAKIAKEYQNSNLLQDNPNWYPENENHDLILPYGCTHASNASYDEPTVCLGDTITLPDGTSGTASSIYPTNDKTSYPWLNVLFYRQRKGNYFNTGSPFPDLLRGDVPTLEILSGNIDWTKVITDKTSSNNVYSYLTVGADNKLGLFNNKNTQVADHNMQMVNNNLTYVGGVIADSYKSSTLGTVTSDLNTLLSQATVSGIQFSLSEWRKLATMTVFRERMARTDGSYNQMIQAQFQHNPNWHEHSVKYCGGSSQPLVFSEVVQQSADASSPLGTTAGRIVSSSGSGEIQLKADDYSIFMTVMTITPDDYYCQGISRMWSELTQSEQYFPILNNLNPQAIKNKELFLTGTDSDDEDILNYQELFSHFKSRQNEVSGLMALPIQKVGDIGAYVFNRILTSKPEFNFNFVTGKFTDNENLCFASTEQSQFIMHISSMFKYVAPMPAITQPSDMGLSY